MAVGTATKTERKLKKGPQTLQARRAPVIAKRREAVAEAVKARRSAGWIVNYLADKGMINPDTGDPWGIHTVQQDIAYLKRQWSEHATRDIGEYVGTMFETCEALIRGLWPNSNDPQTAMAILKVLDREAALLGLDKPKKTELTLSPELLALAAANGVSIKQLSDAMLEILKAQVSQPSLPSGNYGQSIEAEVISQTITDSDTHSDI
jgi:hypothetical protein